MFGTKYLNDEHDCNIVGMNSWIDRSERIATNNFFLCSPLDKNFGVILHHTLRDGYMIQLD